MIKGRTPEKQTEGEAHRYPLPREKAMTNDRPQTTDNDGGLLFRLYDMATGDDEARLCRDIPDSQCQEQPKNFFCHIAAQALSKTGDVLADGKVVLPWVLGAVGAPVFLVGFLVPIRESLALLPQILIGGFIRKFPVRKGFWAVSSLVEGMCVVLMGAVAMAGMRGASAGWTIVGLLVVFSLARGVASIAGKDTLGKTVSKGRRGRVSGYASTASGLVATAVGLYLVLSPEQGRPGWLLYAILIAAGIAWFVASIAFFLIAENPGATEGGRGIGDLMRDQVTLLLKDPELQKFLVARTLIISTALVGPVYVSLAQRGIGQGLDGLGWLVIASGLAGALSSSFWGAFSDKSSRATMALGALVAGLLGPCALVALNLYSALTGNIWFYAVILFVLGIAHAGVRIGRKTQVVDLASGDRKAEYVALSNTVIGVLLLVIGALVGVLLQLGHEVGIAVLSAMALCGAALCLRMKHAQA